MTTRKWKLQGEINWPGKLIVKIDGVIVADKIDAVETTYNDYKFIAEGTLDVDDSVDSKHSIEIEVYEGSMSIGPIWWNNAYVPAHLSEEAAEYKFAHDVVPDDVGEDLPTLLSDEWGQKDPNEFSWYPGKGTLFPTETVISEQDPRANLKFNGDDYEVFAQYAEILAPVGTVISFDFGIPGDASSNYSV